MTGTRYRLLGKYTKPQSAVDRYEVLTESLIVESRDLFGSSNIFISTDKKNPGPFAHTLRCADSRAAMVPE